MPSSPSDMVTISVICESLAAGSSHSPIATSVAIAHSMALDSLDRLATMDTADSCVPGIPSTIMQVLISAMQLTRISEDGVLGGRPSRMLTADLFRGAVQNVPLGSILSFEPNGTIGSPGFAALPMIPDPISAPGWIEPQFAGAAVAGGRLYFPVAPTSSLQGIAPPLAGIGTMRRWDGLEELSVPLMDEYAASNDSFANIAASVRESDPSPRVLGEMHNIIAISAWRPDVGRELFAVSRLPATDLDKQQGTVELALEDVSLVADLVPGSLGSYPREFVVGWTGVGLDSARYWRQTLNGKLIPGDDISRLPHPDTRRRVAFFVANALIPRWNQTSSNSSVLSSELYVWDMGHPDASARHPLLLRMIDRAMVANDAPNATDRYPHSPSRLSLAPRFYPAGSQQSTGHDSPSWQGEEAQD